MTFCQYERPQLSEGNTVVENSFITQYMPDAPTKFVEVYLLGLSLCQENSNLNNLATICNALAIPPDDVINAFMYWEELGIVRIVSPNPPQIVFLSIKSSQALLKKVKPTKYNKFCKEIQDVINGRMITTTEYNEYFIFMESKFFDPEALVCVARYCVENKGADIGYNYILTVARNLACQGYNNLTQVSEKLNSAPKYNDDLSIIFKTLKVNHKADFSDRELYEKWITDYGFTFDVINSVAKSAKVGGMKRLDSLLMEYFRVGLFSTAEIDNYAKEKTRLLSLARDINKLIGVYYQSVDQIVEEYIIKWQQKGYDDETLKTIAKYCFKHSIRTLDGMNVVIEKFFRLGITTIVGLNQYIDGLLDKDKQIKDILAKLGLARNVNAMDRALYATWTDSWNTPDYLIEYACSLSVGANNPVAYLNKILSSYKEQGIKTIEQARSQSAVASTTVGKPKNKPETYRHEYTEEELNTLFSDLDNFKF